ncbi:MAG: glycoside hydrolase family 3 C-terminal domain-containing protein [Candidatus Izemoplasmataceae bacterium]
MQKTIVTKFMMLTLTLMFVFLGVIVDVSASARTHNSDYNSKEETIVAGAELNLRIALEGMVLVKNENDALPLDTGKGTNATRVTLFGYKSVYPEGGGAATADTSAGVVTLSADIYSSLNEAGYVINPTMKNVYSSWRAQADTNTSDYAFGKDDNFSDMLEQMRQSYQNYNDAAIVVLTATNTNRSTLARDFVGVARPNVDPTKMVDNDGNVIPNLHLRQFDEEQLKLVTEATANFDTVIVVINSSVPVEMGSIQDNDDVDAIIIAGEPGANGFLALGLLMNGTVNFSGRLADLYMRDFSLDPTFNNWSVNGELGDDTTPAGNQYTDEDGKPRMAFFVDYEEGIYYGYRYYETRGFDELQNDPSSTWYENNVVYPFGFGLSYTNFSWNILGSSTPEGSIDENSRIKIHVEVTNIGNKAGRDVVQLYYTAPYTNGGIEKAHVVLTDFAKTDTLAPGESQVVTLIVNARDMASYDWNDANNNGFKGYELEAGNYVSRIMKNSKEEVDSLTYQVDSDIQITTSFITGNTIENRFEAVNNEVATRFDALMTRADLGLRNSTTRPIAQDQILTDEVFDQWIFELTSTYDEGKPWFVDEANRPNDPQTVESRSEVAEITLRELIGVAYDDPRWEQLIDQLTMDEMITLLENAGFNTPAIPYIEKPRSFDTDGPRGWTGNGVGGASFTQFATPVVVASTWSKEIAYELGRMIGEQGLWGNSDLESGIKTYSGWYAPGMNLHRSIFDGRYSEYYSEDPVLTGLIAANTAIGASEKGTYVYLKHFALHEDGNTDRGLFGVGGDTVSSGLSIWANEQTMREIYFRPFQIAVEQAKISTLMTSFSRIGNEWAGASYGLLTEILRNEWGFEGFTITDIAIYGFMNGDQMIRAGGDAVLNAAGFPVTKISHQTEDLTATQLSAIRNSVKNVLYTVANSNAMQVPIGARVNYQTMLINDVLVNDTVSIDLGIASLNTQYAYSTISYSVSSGFLPAGLVLDTTTGVLSGTPTTKGTFNFTITASASAYQPSAVSFSINVLDDFDVEALLNDQQATQDQALNTVNNNLTSQINLLNDQINNLLDDLTSTSRTLMLTVSLVALTTVISAASLALVVLKNKR